MKDEVTMTSKREKKKTIQSVSSTKNYRRMTEFLAQKKLVCKSEVEEINCEAKTDEQVEEERRKNYRLRRAG